MKVFDFLKATTSDHRLIKSIAKGQVALRDQQITDGYKLYMKMIEAEGETRW